MKFILSDLINILSRTPIVLSTFLKDLPDDWINNNEGPETWSPYDIIGHLIHGEKTDWIPRVKIILDKTNIRAFDLFDRFAQFENSKGKSLTDLLKEFSELRHQNIITLQSLNISDKDLKSTGIHPELGQITMKQLLATWVVHDLTHINQISRVMALQYKEEIGVWTEFFSLMKN